MINKYKTETHRSLCFKGIHYLRKVEDSTGIAACGILHEVSNNLISHGMSYRALEVRKIMRIDMLEVVSKMHQLKKIFLKQEEASKYTEILMENGINDLDVLFGSMASEPALSGYSNKECLVAMYYLINNKINIFEIDDDRLFEYINNDNDNYNDVRKTIYGIMKSIANAKLKGH